MNGRNLLALACSGLTLMAVAGCARDVPRASIKDTSVAEPPRGKVRGYAKRADGAAADPARVVEAKAAPAEVEQAPPPRVVVQAAPKVVSEPPRIINPAAKSEPPLREAAAGNAAGPGAAVPGINGSGSLTQRIMDQARQRIAAGDVIRAREWLLSGINGARPEVLHELARTFDPNYLNRISQPNAVPEPARARALYEEAIRLGAKGASEDLGQLMKVVGGQP